jgi:hypothetical protein
MGFVGKRAAFRMGNDRAGRFQVIRAKPMCGIIGAGRFAKGTRRKERTP